MGGENLNDCGGLKGLEICFQFHLPIEKSCVVDSSKGFLSERRQVRIGVYSALAGFRQWKREICIYIRASRTLTNFEGPHLFVVLPQNLPTGFKF